LCRSSGSGGACPAGSRAAGAVRLRGGDGQQCHPQHDRGEGAGATEGPGQGRARRSVLRPRHAGRCDPGAGVARRGTAGRGPGGDRGHQLPRREWAESAAGRAPQRTRMDVVISAGRVITASGDLTPGSVEISDGRIVAVRAGAAAEADLAVPDGVLARGLIDLQINGAAVVDFLSPVRGGALTMLRALRERGCVVAAGHTAATYEQAHAAFGAGVTLVTHLFNAMRPVHHRDPGIVVAALEHPQVTVSLIADFIHVHPAVVTLAVRL